MTAWVGYWGPAGKQDLQRLLGSQSQIHSAPDFGVGISSGSRATLICSDDGRICATLGRVEESGCSLSVDPARLAIELCCDPFGFHRIYTTSLESTLWWSSDWRLLQRLTHPNQAIDAAALHAYLCFSYVPNPLTLSPEIKVLPAGASLTIQPTTNDQLQQEMIWCEAEPHDLSESSAICLVQSLLREAVTRRVKGEDKVGVFLSGGLDSSLIAALLVEAGVPEIHLFSLDFGAPFNGELTYARRVAEHLKLPLHVVPATPKQVQKALIPTAEALHQPFGDGVTVPLYLLGKTAAQYVNTIFNGEGGDQLFGGWTNKPMLAAELYGANGYDRESAYLKTFHRFMHLVDDYYTPHAKTMVQNIDAGAWVRPALNAPRFNSLLHRLRATNLRLKGAQNIAPRAAQLAAAHGLRMYSPFFDRALAEATFSLAPEWFLQGSCEKYLLKRVAESYLPPEIVWREKQGMRVPTTEWCLGPMRKDMDRWLSPKRIKQLGWFKPEAVAQLKSGIDQPAEIRRQRIGEKLWALLMLHVWCEVHSPGARWL